MYHTQYWIYIFFTIYKLAIYAWQVCQTQYVCNNIELFFISFNLQQCLISCELESNTWRTPGSLIGKGTSVFLLNILAIQVKSEHVPLVQFPKYLEDILFPICPSWLLFSIAPYILTLDSRH